ncbi:MAG: XRE family transcriptional regulator [Deltaproteobacteria bacterium HGW-Deltaproteobacteria-8]|jgi:transcriptional regulator with XRE-family HTH domain|nr:MAG: XRE family transcriptional regulator [Deltaproteobacteria bacterium HGW-Deltaproteobacteria-8]
MDTNQITQKQVEAAIALGVSKQHLNAVLNGRTRPSVNLAKNIEKQLGIPWQSFFIEDTSTQTNSAEV